MRLNGFSKATFKKKVSTESYPKLRTKRNRHRKPFAMFSSSGSLGQDFVRHIRNGIAHGHAEVYKAAGVDYVEITDYMKGKDTDPIQTAYIAIPLSYLDSILRLYREVEEGSSHQKKGLKR